MKTFQITLSLAVALSGAWTQGCRIQSQSAASPADAQAQADAAPTQTPEDVATAQEQAQGEHAQGEQAQGEQAQGEQATTVVAPMRQGEANAAASEQVEKSDLPSVKDIVPPVCQKTGTRSEGWYRGDNLLIHAPCEGKTPECKMSGTRSEGWYSGDELIEYDQCDGKLPSEE